MTNNNLEEHKKFMKRAIELSLENIDNNLGGPFGAVIVKDNKIIGEGANRVTSANDPTAHAEVMAIREACNNINDFSLKGATIYTSCEPCPMCLAAIYWARIDRIFFANTQKDAANIDFDDEFLYQQIALPPKSRTLPSLNIMHEEALEVFQKWQEKEDKIPY